MGEFILRTVRCCTIDPQQTRNRKPRPSTTPLPIPTAAAWSQWVKSWGDLCLMGKQRVACCVGHCSLSHWESPVPISANKQKSEHKIFMTEILVVEHCGSTKWIQELKWHLAQNKVTRTRDIAVHKPIVRTRLCQLTIRCSVLLFRESKICWYTTTIRIPWHGHCPLDRKPCLLSHTINSRGIPKGPCIVWNTHNASRGNSKKTRPSASWHLYAGNRAWQRANPPKLNVCELLQKQHAMKGMHVNILIDYRNVIRCNTLCLYKPNSSISHCDKC